jgi:NhaP-type Na+/H+ or K+/H+ antiporter
MPQVKTTDFHIVCGVLGVFATLFSLLSYLVKERLFISESLVALVVGTIAGPYICNFLVPERWAGGTQELHTATLDFTRLVLTVQVALAGVQLPGAFVRRAWVSVSSMLSLGMVGMWVVSSLLVWGICAVSSGEEGVMIRMPFLHALAIGACIAPTDPVLAVTVIKGRWADQHVPPALAQLLSAESGANDGLGYPFVFFALYLIQYVDGAMKADAGKAMEMFFGEAIGFVVVLSVAWGVGMGYVLRRCLKFSDALRYVDNEGFYAFTVIMALLLIGTCGLVGSDDILAAFVAGNVLTWDDWFRKQTERDSFEPTVDTLLNWAIFVYFGAVCPWRSFAPSVHGVGPLPLWRLVCLAISVLCLRRVPVVLGLWKLGLLKGNVKDLKQALFMGWFGPIGVSSIFYLHVMMEFLVEDMQPEGGLREDVRTLYEVVQVVVWFVMVSSVVSLVSPHIRHQMVNNSIRWSTVSPSSHGAWASGSCIIPH